DRGLRKHLLRGRLEAVAIRRERRQRRQHAAALHLRAVRVRGGIEREAELLVDGLADRVTERALDADDLDLARAQLVREALDLLRARQSPVDELLPVDAVHRVAELDL